MEKDLAISFPVTLSELARVLVFSAMCLLSFFVPFLLGHPQWLVGTIVNACLFLGAGFLSRQSRGSTILEKLKSGPIKYYLPLVILPSLGVLTRGLVFGPLTMFLVYFLPFIWLGNYILILSFKRVGFIAAAGAKFLFLFLVANIYFNFHLVPKLFLQAMGLNQLATALAGGLISWLIFKIYGGLNARNKRIS